MKCQICKREKLVFFCITEEGIHIVACIPCAMSLGLELIEEVLEVKNGEKGVEGSSRGEGLS